jgi:hypothetical protein
VTWCLVVWYSFFQDSDYPLKYITLSEISCMVLQFLLYTYMFTIPYVHIVQSMHAFKFLINTFFTMHGHASSSAISKRAYEQYAYFVSHIHASILSIFHFTHCIVKMASVLLQITRVHNNSSHWPQHAHNGSIHMKDVGSGVFKVPLYALQHYPHKYSKILCNKSYAILTII